MSKSYNPGDFSNMSMLELFRVEAENQTAHLTQGLLALERDPSATVHLESLMRAAHSLKGAARIVNLEPAVDLAHAMEDYFVAAQNGKVKLQQTDIDLLLGGVDILLHLSRETDKPEEAFADKTAAFLSALAVVMNHEPSAVSAKVPAASSLNVESGLQPRSTSLQSEAVFPAGISLLPDSTVESQAPDRVLRLTAETLNRLLSLAGESLVDSRWLHPFADSMRRLKRLQSDLGQSLENLRDTLEVYQSPERVRDQLSDSLDKLSECRQFLSARMSDLEMFDRKSANLSHRLYLEVLHCRMRPFGDALRPFPRMVRDLARALGKEIRLDIIGENTQVDRDILEKLEAPLAHLLRNAVDHGCELPAERILTKKPAEGVIRLEARHSAGMLSIIVSDDGPGIAIDALRETILERKLTTKSMAAKLSETELLQFLLLPGFTLKDTVTEISGRGVGLDVVQNMVKSVRGNVRISTQRRKGTRFHLQLPLTLSVLRTLLVSVGGEPYAIPLSQINRALRLPRSKIERVEGRHYFTFGDQQIGLVTAHHILGSEQIENSDDHLSVVILGDRTTRYGLVVDELLGERELVVQPLDPRLGKVKDISAGALMEDGSPVLIFDVEDLLRSVEKLIESGQMRSIHGDLADEQPRRIKRILAVDDSMTVRELERQLLTTRGYMTDVAIDGMDAWNAVRAGEYDLVITDVDMPRMDGIELATLIKKDPTLSSIPVMIVSYKDREDDRLRGLDAGADYYLTKGSFHDETLLQAVVDLIGEATE